MPLLERAKFAAIWESNLDEFFMVRAANLHDQVEAGLRPRGADGMASLEQILAIRQRVIAQRRRIGESFERDLRRRWPSTGSGSWRSTKRRKRKRRSSSAVLEAGVPGSDVARDRPRPPFPYIRTSRLLAVVAARSRARQRDPRPGQGAEGALG